MQTFLGYIPLVKLTLKYFWRNNINQIHSCKPLVYFSRQTYFEWKILLNEWNRIKNLVKTNVFFNTLCTYTETFRYIYVNLSCLYGGGLLNIYNNCKANFIFAYVTFIYHKSLYLFVKKTLTFEIRYIFFI